MSSAADLAHLLRLQVAVGVAGGAHGPQHLLKGRMLAEVGAHAVLMLYGSRLRCTAPAPCMTSAPAAGQEYLLCLARRNGAPACVQTMDGKLSRLATVAQQCTRCLHVGLEQLPASLDLQSAASSWPLSCSRSAVTEACRGAHRTAT